MAKDVGGVSLYICLAKYPSRLLITDVAYARPPCIRPMVSSLLE